MLHDIYRMIHHDLEMSPINEIHEDTTERKWKMKKHQNIIIEIIAEFGSTRVKRSRKLRNPTVTWNDL